MSKKTTAHVEFPSSASEALTPKDFQTASSSPPNARAPHDVRPKKTFKYAGQGVIKFKPSPVAGKRRKSQPVGPIDPRFIHYIGFTDPIIDGLLLAGPFQRHTTQNTTDSKRVPMSPSRSNKAPTWPEPVQDIAYGAQGLNSANPMLGETGGTTIQPSLKEAIRNPSFAADIPPNGMLALLFAPLEAEDPPDFVIIPPDAPASSIQQISASRSVGGLHNVVPPQIEVNKRKRGADEEEDERAERPAKYMRKYS